MLGEIKSHVDSCHSQQQLFRINKCFKQTVFLRINRVSPELICGTAGQTSPQTVDWLRSRIFHNVDANSDSSFNLISISLLDLLFHGYPWKIPVRHVIPSCTGQSPLSGGITWHTFFFSFSCFQNKSESEFALWWCSPRSSGAFRVLWTGVCFVCVCVCLFRLFVCFEA